MDVKQCRIELQDTKKTRQELRDIGLSLVDEMERLQAQQTDKNPTERLDEAYSQRAEEEREAKRDGKPKKPNEGQKRAGRISTADKIEQAERTENVYPDGFSPERCKFSHSRVAWRFEDGRAVLIAYNIYRRGKHRGQVAGLLPRSEFGLEVMISLAHSVYCLGMPIDHACKVLMFYQGLHLRKSQADALLNQLSRQWEQEFDHLCTLLANSAVVQCDETSWSINSVWAFLADKLSVLFYGVHKDGQTLAEILDKEVFEGILISDNAAVYQGFSKAQKCWAHLLRKAFKLNLQAPNNATYRRFADKLLNIFRQGKGIASDRRLGEAGRRKRLEPLQEEVLNLCRERWLDPSTDGDEIENDYRRLCNEIMELMAEDELFTFVLHPEIPGDNNESERELRRDATARKTGRTNKTSHGAKRRSIISSVLHSIGKQIGKLTLDAIIQEVNRWKECGQSCFEEMAHATSRHPPPNNTHHGGKSTPAGENSNPTILDRLVLGADK
jgi:transposase